MSETARAVQQAADLKLQSGLDSEVTGTITVAGTKYTVEDLTTVLQGRIDARNATDVAKANYHKAVAAEAAQIAESKVLLARTKTVLIAIYAAAPETLAALGLSEKKVPVRKIAEKSAAIDKAKATREARHTMGPKQKLGVTGVSVALAAAASVPPAAPGGSGHS